VLTAEAALPATAELLSHWWSRPVPDEVEVWPALAGGLGTDVPGPPFGGQLADLLAGRSVGEGHELLADYEQLFVGPGPVPCPPYESYWREDVPLDLRRSLMGPCTAQLQRLYLDLGLEVDPHQGELPDHVAVELEALAYALAHDEGPVARSLFADHLRQWLPRLCRAVSKQAGTEFYRQLATGTLGWVGWLGQRLVE